LGLSDVLIKGVIHGDELIQRIVRLLPDEQGSTSSHITHA